MKKILFGLILAMLAMVAGAALVTDNGPVINSDGDSWRTAALITDDGPVINSSGDGWETGT